MSDHHAGTGSHPSPQALNVAAGQTVRLQQVLTATGTQNVNLLTARGQQFVITSQVSVPGLTQVIPTIATTNAALQQAGVTRILNIAPSPRVNVVGVSQVPGRTGTLLATSNAVNSGTSDIPGRGTVSLVAISQAATVNASSHPTLVSTLSSPPRQRTVNSALGMVQSSPALVLTTSSPNLIRTSGNNAFATPVLAASSSIAPPTSHAVSGRKRSRQDLQEKPPANEEVAAKRRKVYEYRSAQMRKIKEDYAECVAEVFFLQACGNMMDYYVWRKRPPSAQFLHFLRAHRLDPDDDDEDLSLSLSSVPGSTTTGLEVKPPSSLPTPVASSPGVTVPVSTPACVPPAPISSSQQGVSSVASSSSGSPGRVPGPGGLVNQNLSPNISPVKHKLPSFSSANRQHTRQHSISAVYDTSLGSQEQIAEKAKQEAYVMQRIAELQKEGLWSEKRLPRIQEPQRLKAHWDYLLEEMVWLAADFAQERKWKKAAAKKVSRNILKYHQEKLQRQQKEQKDHDQRLRRIASFMAREIKNFWGNVEKLVEFKHQTRLEEKRKKALDQHLKFIVDQTEKYSTWLAEGMNKSNVTEVNTSVPASASSSRPSSPVKDSTVSDDDFKPGQSSSDDEETIAKAEEDMGTMGTSEEVEMLKRESELPLDDFLKELPANYLETRMKEEPSGSEEVKQEEDYESSKGDDEEFTVASDKDSADDEDTIQEQEAVEGTVDHKQELEDLQVENQLSVDELLAKYGAPGCEALKSDHESEGKDDSDDEASVSGSEEVEDEEEEESSDEEEEEELSDGGGIGLKSLLDDTLETSGTTGQNDNERANKEITDVAALAESIQPKGNTLSSTSVVTTIPFLLKHTLREYQHIGLDWLVTMFDRKLNGILADEMGLGKTIQTISLLAHLACEKSNWGPHLIIVPTSVMLNWEMEFKKWCPAFKILTYYGTQKERKQKRIGWTKPNAFHVCITSYKLVIQDHQSFRRKKWKYLILDEAQNIKNFKSQRWQLLLNFQTQRRLLLTGTPLQNNLMELWSLMHFLMPNVFQSHKEFKEWFSNPVAGMIEGNSEYNESIIKRLHKVLRPFLLRRLKTEVEKQLPKKYEHIVMCRLSKRQRFLYDDFMSRAKTKETLATGNLLSVINVLMQLRKVCNHPNLFEVRPTISPFQMEGLTFDTASLVYNALEYDPFRHVSLYFLNLLLVELEFSCLAYVAHRVKRAKVPKKLIEEIDSAPEPPPRCPSGQIRIHVRQNPSVGYLNGGPPANMMGNRPGISPMVAVPPQGMSQGVTIKVTGGPQLQGYSVQIVSPTPNIKANPASPVSSTSQQQVSTSSSIPSSPQHLQLQQQLHLLQQQQQKQGDGIQRITVPAGFAQLVQTTTGRHILLTSSPQVVQSMVSSQAIQGCTTVMTASGQRLTLLPKSVTGITTTTTTSTSSLSRVVTSSGVVTRPVMRVPPLNVTAPVVSTGTVVSTILPGTTTVTTTTTATPTKTSVALSQPVLTAVVHQNRNNVTCNSTFSSTPPSAVSGSMKTRNDSRYLEKLKRRREEQEESRSVFYLPDLEEKKLRRRREKLALLRDINERRCEVCPIYGADLIASVQIVDRLKPSPSPIFFKGIGYSHCLRAKIPHRRLDEYFSQTEALVSIVHNPEEYVDELRDIFSRFVLFVPAVAAPVPKFHVSHPPPSRLWEERRTQAILQQELSSKCALLHPIASAMITQFPDPRLIQYDCGKLQVLDRLLRQLKADHHRVLIFTQMTRMLDVLEAFLNFHGHIYLRLDGTTRVDQRQILMERFNADKRIFCFILSTRSGGIGVNLTGADTVIFYDSDWNPTMDAQAQDRCHRIGQTRDVHIYRLVSEMTVEENILKKANQKRLLGDLAIEGGNFTTAYFKSSTIQDLFNIDVAQNDAAMRMSEVLDRDNERERRRQREDTQLPPSPAEDKAALGALESALAAAEDESDVQAAKTAKAEAAADLAEFDENIPLEEGENGTAVSAEPEISKAELEVENLVKQLTPVERYAMQFMEEIEGVAAAEQLAAAEAQIEQQKREWEQNRLQALRDEEERRSKLEEDDEELLTYSREDALNQVWVSDNQKEQMPIWCPPTPPQGDNDVYIDHSIGFLYEQSIMSEAQLPPIYVRKDHKRRLDTSPATDRESRRPLKRYKEDSLYAPRSLFDRPSPALIKMRRDMKLQKYRGIVRPPIPMPGLKTPTMAKPVPEPDHVPEWLIHEDYGILQAIQNYLELPLNLMVLSPAQTPNWDLVADIVNNVSRTYRSPKQCRNRYECVIAPREEGRIVSDPSTKKQKKNKALPKTLQQTKTNRPMRTAQLYVQDNHQSWRQLMQQRFEVIKAIASKRKPTVKPLLVNPTMRNPKHAAVLAECGINYDVPLTPIEIANRRAERIAKEKQKNAQAAVLTAEQLAAQRAQQQQQQQQTTPVTASKAVGPSTSPQIQVPLSPASASTSAASPTPQAVVVGISQASPTSQQIATVVSTVITAGTVTTLSPGLRTQRAGTNLQEMVAGQVRTSSPAIVSVASLTPAGQRLTGATLVSQAQTVVSAAVAKTVAGGAVTASGKTLTAAQVQFYRLRQQQQQQQLQQQQQQQRLASQQQMKVLQTGQAVAAPGQKLAVAITSGTVGTVTAVHVSQAAQQQQRAQFMKQTAGGKQTMSRTVSESEMTAMIKRQQQLVAQQKAAAAQQVQVTSQPGLPQAHLLAQAGLQMQQAGTSGQTQMATLVKTVSAPGGSSQSVTIPVTSMTIPQVKATLSPGVKSATQQQIRQLTLHHQQIMQQRKLPMQKVAQLAQVAGKGGVPAQLIVQSQKPATMTVQQIQQVIKHVPQGVQHIAHVSGSQAVVTQAPGVQVAAGGQALQTRVIPLSTGQPQTLKQTIQVVTAAPGGVRTSVPNVTIDSSGRPQVSVASTLASALAGTIKVAPSVSTAQQQAILSQVNAALQGQQLQQVRQAGQSPLRIQAVAVQQQPAAQQQATSTTSQPQQDGSQS
ncbi:helicase domino [Anabrus simplex]|uniref:helicase domino n=1 Tax=Anabrus simplex TaxID=316456 RepID=UPI0035A3A64B